jgi:tetratricopeptide (TPR) repeat protein
MKSSLVLLVAIALATLPAAAAQAGGGRAATTAGAIAIANLDHQLAQSTEPAARIELLLTRSRFLADYDALESAAALAESLPDGSGNALLRARTRAAVHRFDAALAELDTALQSGADAHDVATQRASIRIATGHAAETLTSLEADAQALPGYAAYSTLANAYAAVNRYAEADRYYDLALADLKTTSPFPYAWIHFARGLMWSERAGDTARGEAAYDEALARLPEFVTANVHKAEIEIAHNDLAAAAARLERIAQTTEEPEAVARLAEIEQRRGHHGEADRLVERAAHRYDVLLSREPLAFADHAAEFHLGPGANPQAAWQWASRNLSNRSTPRAYAIAIEAAAASGHDACGLVRQMSTALDATGAVAATNEWKRVSDRFADRCR